LASDRFFVKSLTLENFRCFEKVELGPFDPHFNLLVGTNGSGKSSVLLALANLFRRLGAPDSNAPTAKLIGASDVRIEYRAGTDSVRFEKATLSWLVQSSIVKEYEASSASERMEFTTFDHLGMTNWPSYSLSGGEVREASFSPSSWGAEQDSRRQIDDVPLALIAFYPITRKLRSRTSDDNQPSLFYFPALRSSAFANWTDARNSDAALREWIKDETLVALQQEFKGREAGLPPTAVQPLRQLHLIQQAIAGAVEGAKTIEFDAGRKDIVVEFEDGSRKDFSGMSDGQRALIGMVADIARRACLLNAPYLGAQTLLETTGLVLIDELDLHLHPRWQRRVIGDLKRIFPNIQFFATTHSPQIIGEAKPEEIVVLTPSGQKRPTASYGMNSDWVLECVMEAEGRDPEIAKRIKVLFEAIENSRLEEARGMIAELRDVIGEAPDIVAAESYIWNVEYDGEEAAE
jgi:predicted ATP-binding protein involved in virulence